MKGDIKALPMISLHASARNQRTYMSVTTSNRIAFMSEQDSYPILIYIFGLEYMWYQKEKSRWSRENTSQRATESKYSRK